LKKASERIQELEKALKEIQNITLDLLELDYHDNNVKKEKPKNVIKDIIDYLNKTTESNFKATSENTKKLIQARINEGYKFADFKKVIDNQNTRWSHDSKMSQFLRPATLFSNKFEGYLL